MIAIRPTRRDLDQDGGIMLTIPYEPENQENTEPQNEDATNQEPEPEIAPEPEPEPELAPVAFEPIAFEPEPEPDQDEIDLDQFLNVQAMQSPRRSPARLIMPEADRMAIVGIFVDDSGSMDHLRRAVIDGLNLAVEAFKGAKGSDFFLDVRGFKGSYFSSMLRDVIDDQFDSYQPNWGSTPLFDYSIDHLRDLRAKAKQYRDLGIPTTVALLITTDGFPNSGDKRASDFQRLIENGDYIVGMGVAPIGNDESMREYRQVFSDMGITKVVTPHSDPAEVRHAINQFSQSVASIATS
ncbi:MAG: hypothetical protein Q7K65_00950 [Candidatus Buchananbacteria bacterium]|nr:hypothetical protein [Candidatus Buchananbacteria bacterium]